MTWARCGPKPLGMSHLQKWPVANLLGDALRKRGNGLPLVPVKRQVTREVVNLDVDAADPVTRKPMAKMRDTLTQLLATGNIFLVAEKLADLANHRHIFHDETVFVKLSRNDSDGGAEMPVPTAANVMIGETRLDVERVNDEADGRVRRILIVESDLFFGHVVICSRYV